MIARTSMALVLATALAGPAAAAECKDELMATQHGLQDTQAAVQRAATGPEAQKCPAFRRHYAAMVKVRAVFARCDTGKQKAAHAAQLDSSIAEFLRQMPPGCSPSPAAAGGAAAPKAAPKNPVQ
jgi:hypothetical protein